MENKSHVQVGKVLLLLLPVIAVCCSSCSQAPESKAAVPLYERLDTALLQEGDLLFRLGTGLESQAVVATDRNAQYSHVGLLVRENGVWKVLHAVPGEEAETGGEEVLKKDVLPVYFSPMRAVSLCVMRYDTTAEALCEICRQGMRLYAKRIPFDHSYDITDSSKMYCTEFVIHVFHCAGVDLPEGRCHHFPLVKERLVYPLDIIQNPKLKMVSRM